MFTADSDYHELAASHLTAAQYQIFHQGWRVVQQLPLFTPSDCDLRQGVTVQGTPPVGATPLAHQIHLAALLRQLKPWRKGPFDFYGVQIDSEWRSDWKWQRLLPHIAPLSDRLVLDVGCANGYYMWRMVGAGTKLVVGIDPGGRSLAQFLAIRQLIAGDYPVCMLPLTLDKLQALSAFDTVFSMGLLYHQRDPLQHLQRLKQQLRPGGELVLETLVLAGEAQHLLVPNKRYAQMRNVYSIPSIGRLAMWLDQCGFINLRTVDTTTTTVSEQRCTAWSTQKSLADFLDPQNPSKTVEGYPAPLRAIMLANVP